MQKWYVVSTGLRAVVAGPHIQTAKQAAIEAFRSQVVPGIILSDTVCVNQRGFELYEHETHEDEFFQTRDILQAAGFSLDDFKDAPPHSLDILAYRLKATFRRQVWVNDFPMDTESPVQFDATEKLLKLSLNEIRSFRENDYDSDALAADLPERLDWTGPFEVDVDIDGWLERNDVQGGRMNLTQYDLDRLRQEYGID